MYELANRRGPGAVYKYWAWYGVSGFAWPPRRTGGQRVAGVIAGTWPLLGGVFLRFWCCAGVPLRRWHCAWVLLRLWLFARVQPRLRACAWVLVWAVGQLPRAPWLLRVLGRCVPGRVLPRSVRVSFFCVATQSCVSLQPEAYLSLSFVHSRSCQGVLTLCWSVGPLKLSHPWCLLPRLLNQCRLVFVLLGLVLWVVCSRGFVSRSFRCWGFLASFHLCGLPCLDHVPVPSRH